MTAAEELRTAADKLRALAAAATHGPWTTEQSDDYGHRVGPTDQTSWVAWTGEEGDTGAQADADYIAAMHPGVGAALADWLAVAADHVRAQYVCCDNGEHMCSEVAAPALAVARAILGQPAEPAR